MRPPAAVENLDHGDAVLVIDQTRSSPRLPSLLRCGAVSATSARSARVEPKSTAASTSRDVGVTDKEITRLNGPAGLDIGGRNPAETAVSIVAEIIAARSGRTGAPLTTTSGRING